MFEKIAESLVLEMRKQAREEGPVKIVDINEIKSLVIELRLRLILEGITKDLIYINIFSDYNQDDGIIIHELARMLKRKPIKCIQDTTKLARYVIEPRKNAQIKFSEKLGAKVSVVMEQLSTLLGQYIVFDEESEKALSKDIAQVVH